MPSETSSSLPGGDPGYARWRSWLQQLPSELNVHPKMTSWGGEQVRIELSKPEFERLVAMAIASLAPCQSCSQSKDGELIPDALFRLLLDLTMQADPHPWSVQEDEQLKHYLDADSYARGFQTWIDAYHQFGAWTVTENGRIFYRSPPRDGTEEQEMFLLGWSPPEKR